jgi:hypothetical protein
MTKTHYIGMAGIHGCLPQTCEVYATAREACDSLADLHDLGKNRRAALCRDLYLELNMSRDGNEYCEVTSCDCNDPTCHSDSGEPFED